MNSKYIEKKLKKLLIEAQKMESDVAHHDMNMCQWEATTEDKGMPPQRLMDEEDSLVIPFQYLVTSIYLSTLYYLDTNNLRSYMIVFYKLFGKDPNKPKHRDSFNIDLYWTGEPHSVFLSKIRQFLSVFPLSDIDDDYYKNLSGIKYLETILSNTAMIISKSGKKPNTETQVYNAVKNVLESIFPSSISPRSNFIKIAKEYKPDILIPELNAAIEYKYAKKEDKLKATIEQIAADVKGYTGDSDYKVFYAVFYVTEDFWGKTKFKEVWKEQKFPDNWVPFYIVGK